MTVADPSYLAPRYVEVSDVLFAQYRDTITRHGGSADVLAVPLPASLTDDLAFVVGTKGDFPTTGDIVCVGENGRLDAFTAEHRHFVLYES